MVDLIVSITGISRRYFDSGDPTQFSAAKKMSWAARRRTTRIEDMAYCLLGLFNIHMPLLYGEGMKAFQRLQEEILKQTEDDSLFAHSHMYNVLAPSPLYFADCYDVKCGGALPDELSRSLFWNRNVSVTGRHIKMTFPVVPLTWAYDTEALLGRIWISNRHLEAAAEYRVLLNCRKEGRVHCLYFVEGYKGIFFKVRLYAALPAPAAKELETAELMTLTLSRGSEDEKGWLADFSSRDAYMANFVQIAGVEMTPLCRPFANTEIPRKLSRECRDKGVMLRGPSRSETAFRLQYVHVHAHASWVEIGDDVYLFPMRDDFILGEAYVIFSDAQGASFMVPVNPDPVSVNAQLYTDISPWQGKMLDSTRRR